LFELQRSRNSKDGEIEVESPLLDVAGIYEQYGLFIWKVLYRMGVPTADLPDAMQEVLLVVHRRLDSYDRRSKLTTWLFGIGLRVAATARRKRLRRRETDWEPIDHWVGVTEAAQTERLVIERDAQWRLERVLDSLEPEQRALFSFYEIEEMSCASIAELLEIPVGTVHSRLSKLREQVVFALKRLEAQEQLRFGGRA
jgi:RNA polymerase sigma-70 factor (ECF subfamily)